jgi:hypothetical protein
VAGTGGLVMDWFDVFFGYSGHGFAEGTLVLGLFWAALGHPERIRRPLEFRLAVLCLAAAIAATPVIRLAFLAQIPAGRTDQLGGTALVWFVFSSAVPPVLTMFALLLGVDSVLPRHGRGDPKNPAREVVPAGE